MSEQRRTYWVIRKTAQPKRMSWTYASEDNARDTFGQLTSPGWELARVQGSTWTLIAQTASETAA